MSPETLHHLLQSTPDSIQLIDVREPYERNICHIGGELIPMAQLLTSMDHFDKEKQVVIYCKSGGRSALALKLFLNAGFKNVSHLDGGILAWQSSIDQTLARY